MKVMDHKGSAKYIELGPDQSADIAMDAPHKKYMSIIGE